MFILTKFGEYDEPKLVKAPPTIILPSLSYSKSQTLKFPSVEVLFVTKLVSCEPSLFNLITNGLIRLSGIPGLLKLPPTKYLPSDCCKTVI